MPTLDPSIQTQMTDHGMRYVLPRRQLGSLRWAGLIPLAFGVFGETFMIFWMLMASGILHHRVDIGSLFFALFGLIGVIPSLAPIGVGLAMILPSHSVITIDDKFIKNREVAGPFFWTFKRPRKGLQRLRVAFQALAGQKARPQDARAGEKFCGIWAEGSYTKRMIMAPAYPRDLLLPLAQALAGDCTLEVPTAVLQVGPQEAAGGVDVVFDPPPAAEPDADAAVALAPLPSRPATTRLIDLDEPAALTVVVPRMGMRGAAAFFLLFGVIWCGITGAVTAGAIFAGSIQGPHHGHDMPLIGVLGFMGIFWAIGIGMLLAGVQAALRRGVFIATNASLTYSQTGPLGKKEFQWPRESITRICMGDSGTKVNDRMLEQLQIHLASGSKKGLMTGWPNEDLTWLAAILSRKMGVG